MGDSDESSQGGRSSSRSRKTQPQSEGVSEVTENGHPIRSNSSGSNKGKSSRKKKSKRDRRPSNSLSVASETDASEAETVGSTKSSTRNKKQSSSRTKRTTLDEGGAGTHIQDSMLVKIKSKRKLKNGGRQLNKDVSFSGSVIKRDIIKHKTDDTPTPMQIAMGKLPQFAQEQNDDNQQNGQLMAAMGKISPPSQKEDLNDSFNALNTFRFDGGNEGGDDANAQMSPTGNTSLDKSDGEDSKGSALRKGKFGSNKSVISFAADEPEWKVNPDDDEIPKKNKPSFTPVDYGSSDSDDEKPPVSYAHRSARRLGPRRSISMSSIDNSSRNLNAADNSQLPNGIGDGPRRLSDSITNGKERKELSWKPDIIGVRQSTGSNESSEKLRNSLTRKRPGIQRRNTMSSVTVPPNRNPSFDALDTNGNARRETHTGINSLDSSAEPKRTSLLQAAQTVKNRNINQHKQLRRMKMSAEHQTYIPPKSRKTSMLQAVTHLMAGRLVDLTLWTYGASFFKVLCFFLGFYTFNIFLWAAVMDAVDLMSGGRCIHEEPDLLSRGDRYEFVFELAWATFTTVGYGTISPQGDMTGCYPIRFTCAFVAFVGVLFGSTTAAIMYSKLMRLLAKAHVTFSSTLCVQYGKGNEGSTVRFGQLNFRASVAPSLLKQFSAADLLEDSDDEGAASGSEGGFPVIEFRMINDRANHEGSEIWDAQIRGIVQLHKEQPTDQNSHRRNTNSFVVNDKATGGQESTLDLEKKVYYPISLSPDSHPHFSRIWYARHVLNAESPLLKREVRDMIVKDGGKWDKDFNNWEEIRDCLNEFISLRITLSGTSAVSANTVYGEHVYEFDDVCVGWRFANMVYEKRARKRDTLKNWMRRYGFGNAEKDDDKSSVNGNDTRTKIDIALLHDIVPQPGDDFEPLEETKKPTNAPTSFFLKMVGMEPSGYTPSSDDLDMPPPQMPPID